MWIKKKNYSLYISMLIQMVCSTLISIVIFLSLVGLEHYFQYDGRMSIFESIKTQITSEVHHIYAGVFSIILFFTMSIGIVWKIVSYIKKIEDGIKKLPDANMNHLIPVIGTNELARLAQSVNEIKEELKQKVYAEKVQQLHRNTLITNISHDLRTPLTSIIGYLDLAKKNISPQDEAYSYLEIAEKNSLRLKKLISDLFLYSKIISDDMIMDFKKVNIIFLLNQIIELKTYSVNFMHKADELILCVDIENFHRVIDNLLDNANKYSIQEKDITLNVSQDKTETVIEIMNFTKEDLSSKINFLTKRLYTANDSRSDSSSGLGLSIVSELMKRMQGELKVFFDKEEKIFTARVSFTRQPHEITSYN